MKANLTPTTVTDINGRVTTVHKRLDGAQAGKKAMKLPAPALSPKKAPAVQQRTPLEMPAHLDNVQRQVFLEWQRPWVDKLAYRSEIKDEYYTPYDPTLEALAQRTASEGSLNPRLLVSLLGEFHSSRQRSFRRMHNQEHIAANLRNHLLVAEAIGKKYPSETEDTQWLSPSFLEKTIDGYCYSSKQDERVRFTPLETKEELASLVAVSSYLLHVRRSGLYESYRETEFRDWEGQKAGVIYMANRSLDAFLRENPHEVDRVITYTKERGMGNAAKDTKQLIKYLEDTAGNSALSEGWL